MLGRLETRYRALQRRFSRSHWLSRLLRLPVSEGPASRPGLLMIQIDGLSQEQFNVALQKGEMPFLQRLLTRENYKAHAFYSGLPSSTPAVQAELFYGVKTAVPAFSFRDQDSGKVVRMYEPDAATRLERQLEDLCEEPLLKDGSAYSDNFSGGAAEAHFCPSSLGWGQALRAANPVVVLALLLSNLYSFLRTGVLLLLELLLATVDFFRGLLHGRSFIKELKFVPTRVAICILLRELCVIGGKIDLSRGLPIVHINLLGYDEQSHRRGPDSLFAHWTLKGIDDAVARLWREATRSPLRHYEVWVYSDHGQTRATSYFKCTGQQLQDAVAQAFTALHRNALPRLVNAQAGVETQRVRLLGGKRFQRLFSVAAPENGAQVEQPLIAALGPVGFLYAPWRLSVRDKWIVARELVFRQQVPAVLLEDEEGRLHALTAEADLLLPEHTDRLVGADHPFLAALAEDIPRLRAHPCAGDLTLLAWRHGVVSQTFATENGSHAGITPEETGAFCLLPEDTQLPPRKHDWLRPCELREAALNHLGRVPLSSLPAVRSPGDCLRRLRVMTYNVHSCRGMDGRLSAERIARVIARARADVVCLQEVDVNRPRSGGEDQAHRIARLLEMDYHFHPAIHVEEEKYGDAILSHLPLRLVKADVLPGVRPGSRREPRGALWVTVDLDGLPVQIINTHLGLSNAERAEQMEALLSSKWLNHPSCQGPVIFCGDFNAIPSSRICRLLRTCLRDAQADAAQRPLNTYFSRMPTVRIDHIYVSAGIAVKGIEVQRSALAQVASDHLPLVADLDLSNWGCAPDQPGAPG